MDECVSGLHVGLVNDWCICQPRSCGVTISQPAEEGSDGWNGARETEADKYKALRRGRGEKKAGKTVLREGEWRSRGGEIEDFERNKHRERHPEGIERGEKEKLPR